MNNVTFTRDEVIKMLDYLSTRPWKEVNELMVIILNKQEVNPTPEESQN